MLSGGSSSHAKMGLPDRSGVIVGVNTINYDASSSVHNKAKSREKRKMEMIIKAIEAMEKAELCKKDTTRTDKGGMTPNTNGVGKQQHSSPSHRNSNSLIVGVNTINHDASRLVHNEAKSHDERKM